MIQNVGSGSARFTTCTTSDILDMHVLPDGCGAQIAHAKVRSAIIIKISYAFAAVLSWRYV